MDAPVPPTHSANGRVSGKPWKASKSATVRSNLPDGVKTKNWHDRMEKTKKAQAIKKLEKELKDEKQAELQRRREVTLERKKAAEEKRRLEEAKAKMGARKAIRLRRKAGRTKKVNH
ncbi:rRNA-processing protein CGR1 [Leucoagaricus sp. SymC.cos]|nr:rRNA-processing protein CGR1 [Leucoagaricus sp. SymC.cos]